MGSFRGLAGKGVPNEYGNVGHVKPTQTARYFSMQRLTFASLQSEMGIMGFLESGAFFAYGGVSSSVFSVAPLRSRCQIHRL